VKEIEQEVRLGVAAAQMNIRNPDGVVFHPVDARCDFSSALQLAMRSNLRIQAGTGLVAKTLPVRARIDADAGDSLPIKTPGPVSFRPREPEMIRLGRDSETGSSY
jgi:hypothetical protein